MIVVKILRIISGDTQEEVCSQLGCTVSTYNRKENGKAEFTIKELKTLSVRYNVSLDKLINQDSFKNEILSVLRN